MKKLNFLFVLLLSLLAWQGYQGQNVTLPTCDSGIGSNTYFIGSTTAATRYTRNANIVLASQLTALPGANLTSVYFRRFATTGTLPAGNNLKVYMKLTAAADFGAAAIDWATETGTATLVYDGDPSVIVGSTEGYKQFPLIAPFNYTTGSNIAFFYEYSQTVAPSTAITWDYEYGAPCSGVTNSGKYSANATALPATLATSNFRRPLIAFDATFPPANAAPACTILTAPTNNSVGVTSLTTFTWNSVGGQNGASSYLINLGTTPGGTNILNAVDVGNVTTYTVSSALNFNTDYYVTIIPKNAVGNATGCAETKFTTIAAPPANDNCAGAVSLTVNPDYNCGVTTAGTNVAATDSGVEPGLTVSGTPDNDVWYSFVATQTSHRISLTNIVAVVGTSVDLDIAVYSGTCGSLAVVGSSDPTTYNVTGLTIGTTYYVGVYGYFANPSTSNAQATFNICVGTPPPPPANDDCAGAVNLTVNPDFACGAVTAGTTESATASTDTTPTCSATGINDDVWYTFTATNDAHRVSLLNLTGSSTSMAMQAYSGSCGSLVAVACVTGSTLNLTGLTVGDVYTVRVYTSSATATSRASFNICVGTPPPPPANDDCAGAINLTVNADLNCGAVTAGTTESATASTETAPTCSATGINDDVWYTFTATNAAHRVSLLNLTGSSTSMAMQAYSGSCGSLVAVACVTGSTLNLTGLTVGTLYTVRVYTSASTATSRASFNICVGTPPPAPVNDTCAGAIALTPGAMFAQNAITGTNASSTTDGTAACQSSSANNVWYSVIVPANGNITIETDAAATNSLTDTVIQAFSGSCGALASLGCNDDDGNGNHSLLSLTGLAPGSTIYVSVWVWSSATIQEGNFQLSAYDGSLATTNVVKEDKSFTIAPNPFTDVVRISDVKDVVSISIIDLSGRIVKTMKPAREINLGDLKSGMYLINLTMKDGSVKTVKSIKK